MASPVAANRVTPTGTKMPDGFPTKIAMTNAPSIQFWEFSTKPPGIDGGELIPTTNHHNVSYRTFDVKALKTLTNVTGKAFCDPDVVVTLLAQVNINQSMTVSWPTGDKITFWGALIKAEFNEHEEGKPPELTYEIGITNWDPVNKVEAAPVYA